MSKLRPGATRMEPARKRVFRGTGAKLPCAVQHSMLRLVRGVLAASLLGLFAPVGASASDELYDVRKYGAQPERRHALAADDVEDLVVDGLEARCWPDSAAVIRLAQARRAFLRGCRPQGPIDLFLRLEGPRSDGVLLAGNDLSGVGKIVEAGSDVPRTAWSELANHTAP